MVTQNDAVQQLSDAQLVCSTSCARRSVLAQKNCAMPCVVEGQSAAVQDRVADLTEHVLLA